MEESAWFSSFSLTDQDHIARKVGKYYHPTYIINMERFTIMQSARAGVRDQDLPLSTGTLRA